LFVSLCLNLFLRYISFCLYLHVEFWFHSFLCERCGTFLADSAFEICCLTDVEVPVACIILIGLFALQHFGTHRVGFMFAPIVMAWLFCISAIGIYNIFHWNSQIYRALCPIYALRFMRKNQTGGWMALGGVLLSITGLYVLVDG